MSVTLLGVLADIDEPIGGGFAERRGRSVYAGAIRKRLKERC